MPLTALDIYKVLPKTNCGECGVPTCLAFAMQLATNYFNNTQTSISLTLEAGNLQALQSAIASGNPPDMVGPMGISTNNYFHGQWLDLTPLAASTGLTLTDFYTEVLDLYREGGKLLGLPV